MYLLFFYYKHYFFNEYYMNKCKIDMLNKWKNFQPSKKLKNNMSIVFNRKFYKQVFLLITMLYYIKLIFDLLFLSEIIYLKIINFNWVFSHDCNQMYIKLMILISEYHVSLPYPQNPLMSWIINCHRVK